MISTRQTVLVAGLGASLAAFAALAAIAPIPPLHTPAAHADQPANTQQAAAFEPGTYTVATPGSTLNVRQGPGVGNAVTTSLANGTNVTVTQTQGDWGRIEAGWINLQYCTAAEDTSAQKTAEKTADDDAGVKAESTVPSADDTPSQAQTAKPSESAPGKTAAEDPAADAAPSQAQSAPSSEPVADEPATSKPDAGEPTPDEAAPQSQAAGAEEEPGGPVDPEQARALRDARNASRAYIRMLYSTMLDNDSPTEDQLGYWTDMLVDLGAPQTAVAFASTDSFTTAGYTREEMIMRLAAAFLGDQDPDADRLEQWDAFAAEKGTAGVAAQMAASDEFMSVEHYAQTVDLDFASIDYEKTPEGYVRMLYGRLLGNSAPTEFQVKWWQDRFASIRAAAVVSDFVTQSVLEGTGNSAEDARWLYSAILDEPDPQEEALKWWAGVISQDGLTSAAARMTVSDSFEATAQRYGLEAPAAQGQES